MYEIVFIMGKSSSGKDSIYKKLKEDDKLGLTNVVLYTTRPRRDGETDGVEYNFVTDEKEQEMEKLNKIIELRCYNTAYGVWKYFTADDGQIDLNSGSRYIVIGTLEAYEQFINYFGKEHILPIYIEVDDRIRLQRAIDRENQQKSPKYIELCRRFLADDKDFGEDKLKQAGIVKRFSNNGNIEDCINMIKKEILK